MKTLSSYTMPKLARNLTGGGKSPPLVDNSTLLGRLDLLNPFRWLNKRITQRPLIQLPVDLFTLMVCITLVLESSVVWAAPVQNSANDHYYEVISTSFTFDNAVAVAASTTYLGRPGRLVTINDAAEQSFIVSSLGLLQWGVYWIGGKRVSSVNQWITTEPFTYTNWIATYPNTSDYGFSIGGSGYSYQWGSQTSITGLGNYIVEYISLQSITFTPPASGTYGGSATLSATTTSGLAVTFASTTTGICTVSGTTVNYVSAGTCTVTADQAGDATYNAAPQVSQSITVNSASSAPISSPSSSTDLTPYQYTGLGIRVAVDGTGQGRVVSTTSGIDQAIDCSITNPTGCMARFAPAAEVTLVATPAEGSTFAGWGGNVDCVTGHFLVTGGKLCIAFFDLVDETLTVAVQGQGSVTATALQCPGTCTTTYPYGTSVTLQAQPATGWEWQAWSGDCNSQGQVLLTGAKRCVATFVVKSDYNLTVTVTGRGTVSSPSLNCPDQCMATYLAGTTVTLTAKPANKLKWFFQGWSGGCNAQGQVTLTQDTACQAVFTADPNIPNAGDGNGDGQKDPDQDNVVSLPDKVTGTYLTLETQPATCIISDIYPDLPETQTVKLDHTKKFPQGMLYFDIACPQAQVSVYYHAMSKLYRNLKFYKFGPKIPGDLTTIAWYPLPNIKYEVVMVGGKPVVKGTYTLKDGELGDSTGVDGHIVDPGGLVYP
jgi:hypothetical protein